jgi:hypothetical protein
MWSTGAKLNRLIREDEEREEKAKQDFDDRVKAAKRKAIGTTSLRRRRRGTNEPDHRRAAIWWCRHDKLREREVADENEQC